MTIIPCCASTVFLNVIILYLYFSNSVLIVLYVCYDDVLFLVRSSYSTNRKPLRRQRDGDSEVQKTSCTVRAPTRLMTERFLI